MNGRRFAAAGLLLFSLLAAAPAGAVRPDEMLSDPALEARARAISKEIRCVVCQSENIDDSDADMAHDLRVLIREQLVQGKSDEQVRDFLVARYGDFVLLKPPFKAKTLLLWIGPFALLVIAAGCVLLFYRRRNAVETPDLTAEERDRLKALLAENAEPAHRASKEMPDGEAGGGQA